MSLAGLHEVLKSKYGDQFTGITRPVDMKLPTIICWASPPDSKIKAEAQALADAWDWTEKPVPVVDVDAKFSKLKSDDKNKLLDQLLKEFLASRPDLLDLIQ
jgi:hypothetical protein